MLKVSFGALIILAVVGIGFAGFRGDKMSHTPVEWFNDMAHQPKYEPQHRSEFFNDSRAARLPIPGTVPIGFTLEHRYDQTEGNNLVDGSGGFTNRPDYYNTGRIGDVYGHGIPDALAARGAELLVRGQQRFNIYCGLCPAAPFCTSTRPSRLPEALLSASDASSACWVISPSLSNSSPRRRRCRLALRSTEGLAGRVAMVSVEMRVRGVK